MVERYIGNVEQKLTASIKTVAVTASVKAGLSSENIWCRNDLLKALKADD